MLAFRARRGSAVTRTQKSLSADSPKKSFAISKCELIQRSTRSGAMAKSAEAKHTSGFPKSQESRAPTAISA